MELSIIKHSLITGNRFTLIDNWQLVEGKLFDNAVVAIIKYFFNDNSNYSCIFSDSI